MFFELEPRRSVLSDANRELVVCFQEVARSPHSVVALLDTMPNTREYFIEVRSQDSAKLTPTERAARVIYLNKTCFRGLWRVNRSGKFNVPYGEYDRPYYNLDNLLLASKKLAIAEIRHADYVLALQEAQKGDWIYLDPPYIPDRPCGDFKRYTAEQFYDDDHKRLAALMKEADKRGVYLMLSNSDTPTVREIFAGFNMLELSTRRDIHLKARERASVDLVITNYSEFARSEPDGAIWLSPSSMWNEIRANGVTTMTMSTPSARTW